MKESSAYYQLELVTSYDSNEGFCNQGQSKIPTDVIKDPHIGAKIVHLSGNTVRFTIDPLEDLAVHSESAELERRGDAVCWASEARLCVVGDRSGVLHFVLPTGQKVFSQPITKEQPGEKAFYGVAFAPHAGLQMEGLPATEDLFALSTDGRLFCFADLNTTAICQAAETQDQTALQAIRAAITVSISAVDLSNAPAGSFIQMQVCQKSSRTSVYIAHGGISVWQTSKLAGSKPLTCIDELAEESIGGTVAAFKIVNNGKWLLILDSKNQMSWWDTRSLLNLGSWQWESSTMVKDFAVLPSTTKSDSSSAQGLCVACITWNGIYGSEKIQFLQLNLSEISALGCIPVSRSASLAGPGPGDDSFFIISSCSLEDDNFRLSTEERMFIYRCAQSLPIYRLQSLVAAGKFEEALELCSQNDMDESDIYEAELQHMLGKIARSCQTTNQGATGKETEIILRDAGSGEGQVLKEGILPKIESLLSCLQGQNNSAKLISMILSTWFPSFEDTRASLNILKAWVGAVIGPNTANYSEIICNHICLLETYELLTSGKSFDPRDWQRFKEADMINEMANALRSGSIGAAALLWNRHVRSLLCPVPGMPATCSHLEKLRMEDQADTFAQLLDLLTLQTPVQAYAGWLQAEVLPGLGAAGALAARAWAAIQARRLEGQQRSPKEALALVYAVLRGTAPVLGAARAALTPAAVWSNLSADWVPQDDEDPLEKLLASLTDLVHLWEKHELKLSLAEFEKTSQRMVAFMMLDRVQSPDLLRCEVSHHVASYCSQHGLDLTSTLLEYVHLCCEAIALGRHGRAATATTERRAIAMVHSMSSNCMDMKGEAVLSLIQSATPPFSEELWAVVDEAMSWQCTKQEELQEAARILQIGQIVRKYHVENFNILDPTHASRLLQFVVCQPQNSKTLDDALQIAAAYTHIAEDQVYLQYLQNFILMPTEVPVEIKRDALNNLVNIITSTLSGIGRNEGFLVGQELMLLCCRTLEDLELEAADAGKPLGELISKTDEAEAQAAARGALAAATALKQHGASEQHHEVYLNVDRYFTVIKRVLGLQSEFGLYPSVASLEDKKQCQLLLNKYLATTSNHHNGNEGLKHQRLSKKQTQDTIPLPSTLRRIKKVTQLLGLSWPKVIGTMAQESALTGQIAKTGFLTKELIKYTDFEGTGNLETPPSEITDAALSLKAISEALFKFIGQRAQNGAVLSTPAELREPVKSATVQAAVHAMKGLQLGLTACDAKDIKAMVDLEQGCELMMCLIRECGFRDALDETLLRSSTGKSSKTPPKELAVHEKSSDGKGKGKGKGKATLQFSQVPVADVDQDLQNSSDFYLYKWYRGDGLALPLQQCFPLAVQFVFQEMADRGVVPGVKKPSEHAKEVSLERLMGLLDPNGIQQLSLRVFGFMNNPPTGALAFYDQALLDLTNRVLSSRNLDCTLAIGYMLSLTQKEALNIFKSIVPSTNRDFSRMRMLARLGKDVGRAWEQHTLLANCAEMELNAHWWHVLSALNIPFDSRHFNQEGEEKINSAYQRRLVPLLLNRSGGDLWLTMEFCQAYQIEEAFPCLLFVEQQLLAPCQGPSDLEYQDRILAVLADVHEHQLVLLLKKAVPNFQETDYERMIFTYSLLLERIDKDGKEWKQYSSYIQILKVLKTYRTSKPLSIQKENSQHEVYQYRIPFKSLVQDFWSAIQEEINCESVAKLVALTSAFGFDAEELYSRLVKKMVLKSNEAPDSPVSQSSWEAICKWLSQVRSPRLAIETAIWISDNFCDSQDRLNALQWAADFAKDLPQEHAGLGKGLKTMQRDLQYELTINQLGDGYLEPLRPFFDRPMELVSQLYQRTAAVAASKSLVAVEGNEATGFCRQAFWAAANKAHTTAAKICKWEDTDTTHIRHRLVNVWLLSKSQQKEESSPTDDSDSFFGMLGSGSLLGEQQGQESVFIPTIEEKSAQEDAEIALKVAFVLNVPSVHPSENAEVLVPFVQNDTKDMTHRGKLRALRSIAVMLPPFEAKELVGDVGVESLAEYTRLVSYMARLEELRLVQEMSTIQQCSSEALVRSLYSHHRDEVRLLPLLCTLMLDNGIENPQLWTLLLQHMKRSRRYRSLLHIFVKLSICPFIINYAEPLSALCKEVLMQPLNELASQQRRELEIEKHSKDIPSLASSIAYGGTTKNSNNAALDAPQETKGEQEEDDEVIFGVSSDRLWPVLDQILTVLQTWPAFRQLDIATFLDAFLDLGEPLLNYTVKVAALLPTSDTENRKKAIARISKMEGLSLLLTEHFNRRVDLQNDDAAGKNEDIFGSLMVAWIQETGPQAYKQLNKDALSISLMKQLRSANAVNALLQAWMEMERLTDCRALASLYYQMSTDKDLSKNLAANAAQEQEKQAELEKLCEEFGIACQIK